MEFGTSECFSQVKASCSKLKTFCKQSNSLDNGKCCVVFFFFFLLAFPAIAKAKQGNTFPVPSSIVPFLESLFLTFFLGTFWYGANSTMAEYSPPENRIETISAILIQFDKMVRSLCSHFSYPCCQRRRIHQKFL